MELAGPRAIRVFIDGHSRRSHTKREATYWSSRAQTARPDATEVQERPADSALTQGLASWFDAREQRVHAAAS